MEALLHHEGRCLSDLSREELTGHLLPRLPRNLKVSIYPVHIRQDGQAAKCPRSSADTLCCPQAPQSPQHVPASPLLQPGASLDASTLLWWIMLVVIRFGGGESTSLFVPTDFHDNRLRQ
jgi:hypothetical protein